MKKLLAVFVATLIVMACLFGVTACGGTTTKVVTKTVVKAPALTLDQRRRLENWGHPPNGRLGIAPSLKGVPTVEMYDTTTLATVPANPRVVAGYVDGHWQTYLPLKSKFPKAIAKSIAVFSWDRAQCGDFEPGDMNPGQVVKWYKDEVKAGYAKPCIYSSFWEFTQQIIPLLNANGIHRSAYWAWDANYTFIPHIDAGFDATQWTDVSHGLNLDESMVTYAFAGIPTRVICFGKGALNTAQCKSVRKQLAYDLGAVVASNAAHQSTLSNIARLQDVDKTFQQRIRYFSTQIAQLVAKWS